MKQLIRSILKYIGVNITPTYPELIRAIAKDMQALYGVKHEYVVVDPSGNGTLLAFRVAEWHRDYFIVHSGAIYPYASLGGYFMPPKELADKLRAKESGIQIARVH